jgi:Permuted papain-like amidase enzyme, YaeF/YiiX, C92 family
MRAFLCQIAMIVSFVLSALMPASLWGGEGLRTGDLIFQDLACGELCDAIEAVTREQFHAPGPALSHVGVVVRKGAKTFVLEAYGDRVRLTPLADVRARQQDSSMRVIPLATLHGVPEGFRGRVAHLADRFIGKPYDNRFVVGDDAYYCSDLVYEMFKEANGGKEFFHLTPMTFGTPGSDARKVWKRYFDGFGIPIPEGQPGLSPLGMWLEADAMRRHR